MYQNIYYTFLAGWCADAIGARLEFCKNRFTEEEVVNAMHFIGDKTNGINEGQFTDDSEMELALLDALVTNSNTDFFPIEEIALNYIKWYNSKPFDIGSTISNSLKNANNAEDMINNAYDYNKLSESNGTLMRCIPLAVFLINKPIETIFNIVEAETSLTHYSQVVSLVTTIYCFIISYILSKTNIDINIIMLLEQIKNYIQISKKVGDWYTEAIQLKNLNNYNSIKNEGHIKHAFIFVIYFLKNIKLYTYEQAIKEVLMCGGDTDTNAKIVGNLFGAYYGDCIPKYISQVVLNFDCTSNNLKPPYKRPAEYSIKKGLELIDNIYKYFNKS